MEQFGLDELIEDLQRRGVEQGQAQADEIIEQAKKKAEQIVEQAKLEAAQITEEADRHRSSTRQALEAELRQAVNVGLAAFRQAIENGFVVPQIDKLAASAAGRPGFMEDAIGEMVRAFAKQGMRADDIEVLLPKDTQDRFTGAFMAQLAAKGAEGVKLRFDDSLSFGFRIGPSKGGFTFDLSDEGFRQVLSRFLSRRFRAYFYPPEQKATSSEHSGQGGQVDGERAGRGGRG